MESRVYTTEAPQINANTAIDFLCFLKDSSENEEGLYLRFLEIMQDYKKNSIDAPQLVEKVKALLKDRPDIFMAFKPFIPGGYEVQRTQYMLKDMNQALIFVKKIKEVQDEDSYKRFLNILRDFSKGNRSPENIYRQVADLWKRHPGLLEEFLCFFPNFSNNRCASQFNTKTPLVKHTHMREMNDELVGYKNSPDKCYYNPPSAKSNGGKHERHADGMESQHRQFVLAQKLAEGNGQPLFIKQNGKMPIMSDESRREQTRTQEQDRNVIVPLVNFLKKKLGFLRLVESNLKETFEEYLMCLEMHSEGTTNYQDFNLQVADLFSKSPELIAGTMDLLRQCETAELELIQRNGNNRCKKRSRGDEGESMMEQRKKSKIQLSCALNASSEQENYSHKHCLPSQKTPCMLDLEVNYSECGFPCPSNMKQNNGKTYPSKESSPNKSSHTASSECMEEENTKINDFNKNPHKKSSPFCNASRVEQEISKRHLGEENLYNKYSPVTSSKEQENSKKLPGKEDPSLTISSKYLSKPISDLDLSKCEQCTPSYRRLPNDYPLPTAGSRSAIGRAVLNDTWVSARSGRESSFNCMRKNKYEEVLRDCEDDRTDLDLLIENANSTIKGLEDMLKRICNNQGMPINITARQVRSIEQLYGDFTLEVLECLHRNPASVTPVILQRVKQKKDEWLVYKAEMRNVWAEVFVKNYHKSLDCCSIYNSDQNLKDLSTHFLAEMRNLNAVSRKSDDFFLLVTRGISLPLVPALTLNYQDAELHKDVHEILQYSVKKLCSNAEQRARVMHMWKGFLEPLFGAHCGSIEDNKLCEFKPDDSLVNYPVSMEGRASTQVCLPTAMVPTKREPATSIERFSEGAAMHLKNDQKICKSCKQIKVACNDVVTDCEHYIDGLNHLKYLKKEEKEEGEISPSPSADEEYLDGTSHAKHIEIALADKYLDECSSFLTTHKQLVDGYGYEQKEEVTTAMDMSSETLAAYKRSRNADDIHANLFEGDASMKVPNMCGSVESEKLSCTALPLFTSNTSASLGDSIIFYGNTNMYLILRFYQALYDKIYAAKVQATTQLKSNMEFSSLKVYHNFLQDLQDFINETSDSAKFERDCRALAGSGCHRFLSIDKLIFNLVKQLMALASDEMAINLLALRTYEHLHASGGINDATYLANACMLLHGKNVFRFERRFETGQLLIQMMDGCFGQQSLPHQMHPKFTEYLSNFMLSEACGRLQKDHVFLKRNVLSCALHDNQLNAFQNTFISNSLQLKIHCKDFRASYVYGTEDYFHRRKVRTNNAGVKSLLTKTKNEIFHRWLKRSLPIVLKNDIAI
ncbi:hypothetical protein L7F22_041766 [Adiantum nelumboides]|nr:hypothetical protein [Adiantum nelumboides]